MIKPSTYLMITSRLGEMNSLGVHGQQCLDEITSTLDVVSVDPERRGKPEVIRSTISTTIDLLARRHVTPSEPTINVVRVLQNAIRRSAGSVDSYLEFAGIKVSVEFASLSAFCGFPIAASNIDIVSDNSSSQSSLSSASLSSSSS